MAQAERDDQEMRRLLLEATDDEVGPACMNVQVPPTIATDDQFREIYSQGYRHALAAARRALRGAAMSTDGESHTGSREDGR